MNNSKSASKRASSTASSKTQLRFESPLILAGESELLDAEGNVRSRSRRFSVGSGKSARQSAAFAHAMEKYLDAREITPVPRIKAPKRSLLDIAVAYVMGDPHMGMYAWAAETGQDFDLKIAERNLISAAEDLVERSPAAAQGLLVNVGDFFHADNMQNRTERGGNALDVDTRYPHVVAVGLRVLEHIIFCMLKKHKTVHVINEIGNHDTQTAHNAIIYLARVFRDNPRVTVDNSPAKCHYWRFGQTLIGTTHGDTIKPDQCRDVMATDRKELWGQTSYRYWYTGHIHHSHVWEYPGVIVESFRTLAPRDAWHESQGYRSGRDMQSIVLHKEYGEIERRRADIALVEARAAFKAKRSK